MAMQKPRAYESLAEVRFLGAIAGTCTHVPRTLAGYAKALHASTTLPHASTTLYYRRCQHHRVSNTSCASKRTSNIKSKKEVLSKQRTFKLPLHRSTHYLLRQRHHTLQHQNPKPNATKALSARCERCTGGPCSLSVPCLQEIKTSSMPDA
jgi:hypothetical protein